MVRALEIIKSWFVTNAQPTQAQFHDTWDSFRHKNDPVSINDLDTELANALQDAAGVADQLEGKADKSEVEALAGLVQPDVFILNGTGSIATTANTLIELIVLETAAPSIIKIGTVENGDDIMFADEDPFTEKVVAPYRLQRVPGQIFFTGVTSQTKVSIYKRNI